MLLARNSVVCAVLQVGAHCAAAQPAGGAQHAAWALRAGQAAREAPGLARLGPPAAVRHKHDTHNHTCCEKIHHQPTCRVLGTALSAPARTMPDLHRSHHGSRGHALPPSSGAKQHDIACRPSMPHCCSAPLSCKLPPPHVSPAGTLLAGWLRVSRGATWAALSSSGGRQLSGRRWLAATPRLRCSTSAAGRCGRCADHAWLSPHLVTYWLTAGRPTCTWVKHASPVISGVQCCSDRRSAAAESLTCIRLVFGCVSGSQGLHWVYRCLRAGNRQPSADSITAQLCRQR